MRKLTILITTFFLLFLATTAVVAADLDVSVEVPSTATPTPTPTPLPAPSITYVDVVASNGLRTLTIIGTNFVSGATIEINGVGYNPVFLDSNHLQISLSSLPDGTITITVINPDTQNDDYVFSYVNPTPTPTATPTSTPATTTTVTATPSPSLSLPLIETIDIRPNIDGEYEIMIIGKNFQEGVKVFIDGIEYDVVFIDSEHILLRMPSGLSGDVVITVVNPDGGSGTSNYSVVIPTPTTTPVVEENLIEILTINKEDDTLLLTGRNFVDSITAYIDGEEVQFEYIDSNHMRIIDITDYTGTVTIRLVDADGNVTEKQFVISQEVELETLPLTGVIKQFAEQVQAEVVAITGVTTLVAVASLADYLKLAFIPWRKRKKYWGLVLDSRTSSPIPLAVINVFDLSTNKIVATTVSDMEGRYGVILDQGSYQLDVKHYEYTLAVNKLPGIYFGQAIEVKKESQLDLNILMDKTSHSSEPIGNKLKKLWHAFMVKFSNAYPYILTIFLAVNIYFLAITSEVVYVYLVIYHVFLVLFFFFSISKYRGKWATCIDSMSGQVVPRALVKLYKLDTNELVDTKVADAKGRVNFIIPSGQYQLIASAAGYSFPSTKDRSAQDIQNKFIIEFDNTLSVEEIPFDSMQGAQLLNANKFGVIQ